MAQIKWTEPALNVVNEIANYIALDNVRAAKKLVSKILKSVKRLNDFPLSGKVPDELADSRFREIIVGPCRLFYRIESEIVFILYVMRCERTLRQFILHERHSRDS